MMEHASQSHAHAQSVPWFSSGLACNAALVKHGRVVSVQHCMHGGSRQRDTSRGIGGGELPRRVHHDDIELGGGDEPAPVVGGDVGMDWDAVRRHLPLAGVQVVHIAKRVVLLALLIAQCS